MSTEGDKPLKAFLPGHLYHRWGGNPRQHNNWYQYPSGGCHMTAPGWSVAILAKVVRDT